MMRRMISHAKSISSVCIVAGLFLVAPSVVVAQSDGYRAPRTADGTPDFNGIWQAMNTAHWDIEPHGASQGTVRELGALIAMPGGLGVVEGDLVPYRQEALEQRNDNFADRVARDPAIKCYLPGVPRATYMPYPFQIIQSNDHIMILHEFAGAVRTVYMQDHVPAPAPSWMGWSNGRWDGETLVIETEGFNGMTWFDRSGNFHSDELRVIERISARSPETLNYEVTIDDPEIFTRSWTMHMPLYRRVEATAELMEFRCVEFVEDLIYGHLRKQPD